MPDSVRAISIRWLPTAGCRRLGAKARGWSGCETSSRRRCGHCRAGKLTTTTRLGVTSMPRKLPLYVERNYVKGKSYYSFRRGKGARIRLPGDPTSPEFLAAYQAAFA